MPSSFRQELIESIDEKGRPLYQETMDAIGGVVGREGTIAGINIRVIKGIQQLALDEACLTQEGLATKDRAIIDCSAAMVRRKDGTWQRYSGKDSAHPTRLFSSYNPTTQTFSLWGEDNSGSTISNPQSFPASVLAPRDGERIMAKIGGDVLEGVLEDGPVTAHIQACLRSFEKDTESIGLLLRPPSFQRFSDTRTPGRDGVYTLYSDGSQIHAMNRRTILEWQNATIDRAMFMENYRAGLEIDGDGMPPNIEDIIYEMRVRTQEGTDVPLFFTSLTPRCLVTQRELRTGKVAAEPKLWNRKHRPRRPWDGLATMGANVDTAPECDGAIIRVGNRFVVLSEKTQWRQ